MMGKQCLWLPGFFLNALQVCTDVFLSLQSLSSPLDATGLWPLQVSPNTLAFWMAICRKCCVVVWGLLVHLSGCCLPLSQGLCVLHCISLEFWDLLAYTGDKINISSANQWVKGVPTFLSSIGLWPQGLEPKPKPYSAWLGKKSTTLDLLGLVDHSSLSWWCPVIFLTKNTVLLSQGEPSSDGNCLKKLF